MFFLETSQFPVSMWSTTLVKKSPECAYRLSRLEIVFMHAHAHKQTHTHRYIYIYMCQQTQCLVIAKIVICHFQTLHFVQANRVTCGHQWFWARAFCVAGAVFCDGCKNLHFIFGGRRAGFSRFFCDCLCFFSWFMVCALCVFFLHWTACSICVPRAVAQCFAMVEKTSVIFSLARACARFSLLLMSRTCVFFFHVVLCASCFSLFFFQCKVFSFQLFQRDAFFFVSVMLPFFWRGGSWVGGGVGR